MRNQHSYRETSIEHKGRVNGMCEPDDAGKFTLVKIGETTYKLPNEQIETFVTAFAPDTGEEPEA